MYQTIPLNRRCILVCILDHTLILEVPNLQLAAIIWSPDVILKLAELVAKI